MFQIGTHHNFLRLNVDNDDWSLHTIIQGSILTGHNQKMIIFDKRQKLYWIFMQSFEFN